MNTSKKTLLVFVISPIIILVQIILGGLLVQKIVQVDRSSDTKAHLESYLRKNLRYLSNAETGQRGYLLTRDAKYLKPYDIALKKIADNNQYLTTISTPAQQEDFKDIQFKSKKKLDELAFTIKLQNDGNPDSAIAIVKTDYGLLTMDSITQFSNDYITNLGKNIIIDETQERYLSYVFVCSMMGMFAFHLFFWYFIYYRFDKYNNHIVELVDRLNESNRYFEQFAYISAHDIKSPIITTQGLVNILVSGNAIKPEFGNIATMLKGTVDQMYHTNNSLNNILKVKKELLEKGDIPDQLVPLKQITTEVLNTLQHIIQQSGAQIKIELGTVGNDNFPEMHFQSVLHNLLSNALKFKDVSRPLAIDLTVLKTNGNYVFNFRDNGIGMDLERNQQKLYGIFNRFHDHVEGSGVGLHIVKSIVDAYDGTIDIVSTLNKGTAFTITFPTTISPDAN